MHVGQGRMQCHIFRSSEAVFVIEYCSTSAHPVFSMLFTAIQEIRSIGHAYMCDRHHIQSYKYVH